MHSFLRAIGFGNLKKNKEIDDLLNEVIEKPTRLQVAKDSNGNEFTEFSREFGGCIGITACGNTETTGNLNSIIIIRISAEPKVQRQRVWKWKNIPKRNLMPESVMI